jgi:Fur family zinc uptake transcriptional regulator
MARATAVKKVSNSEMVAAALRKAGKPLTAYEVLDQLRDSGVSGPPTVYRALEKLISDGHVHRLESLNAFVWCNHSHDNDAAAFAICDDCGTVSEFSTANLSKEIAQWARKAKFKVALANLEIHGHCANCRATDA